MASICEEAPNPPDAQTVAMDAKLMVATDRGDVNKLKNLLNKEDAMAMVVVTATSKKPSEKDDQTPAGLINPLLLASAHHGSWKALHFLLEREDAGRPPMATPTQEFLALLREGKGAIEAPLPATGDVEDQGVEDHPQHDEALPASGTLLKGVTPDGDNALHAVAMNGNGEDFLKYADTADIICGRDMELLFAKNHRGETPLHCAARAGAHKMVSHLIALAGREGADRKLELLRMANKCHETALHEAVRVEDGAMLQDRDRASVEAVLTDKHGKGAEEKSMVKLLMDAYPGLANYPVNGISPLYLAISLRKDTIAVTLYKMSGGNLSYSGQEGQNALHAAVLLATDGGA
nr:unnamed protein product [Digitaria exilis]